MSPLERGNAVPHFTVTKPNGERVNYGDVWQHQNLVLVVAPLEQDNGLLSSYLTALANAEERFRMLDAVLVVTSDTVAGAPQPCVIVADRWGEIYFVAGGITIEQLPDPDAIIDWLEYIENECPECQGEAR